MLWSSENPLSWWFFVVDIFIKRSTENLSFVCQSEKNLPVSVNQRKICKSRVSDSNLYIPNLTNNKSSSLLLWLKSPSTEQPFFPYKKCKIKRNMHIPCATLKHALFTLKYNSSFIAYIFNPSKNIEKSFFTLQISRGSFCVLYVETKQWKEKCSLW